MTHRYGRVGLLLAAVGLLGYSAVQATAELNPSQTARPGVPTSGQPHSHIVLPPSPLTEEQQILHVLSRLGYGPRPGDTQRVHQMGVPAWIERQLHPEQIADDTAERAVAAYPTLGMSTAELLRDYPKHAPRARGKAKSGEATPKDGMGRQPPEKGPYRITAEMQAAKITRAVLSERQLQEVMVDFWFNHFNVFGQRGAVKWLLPAYEREAIRPRALGHFRDLVLATARHPAMLFYLDNWLSTRADLERPGGKTKGRKSGLNENYARELMELHTLGVDGGYTQQDVIEVARAFTGWTISGPNEGREFVFRAKVHDSSEKRVLGQVIPAGGGEQDGMRVIDILVHHPSTARFISTKLVRRFVSDDPPPALVERASRTFRDTDGDIRAVLITIFNSPEFFSQEAYRAKIKTPVELVASAVRALDGQIAPPTTAPSARAMEHSGMEAPASAKRAARLNGLLVGGGASLAGQVAVLGEPLYQAQPPTGYSDVAEAWVNTGVLLNRMNFGLALAHNRLTGVVVEMDQVLAGTDRRKPAQVLARLEDRVLHGQLTPATRAVLAAQLATPEIARVSSDGRAPKNADAEKLVALVLGSPEFQRR